MFSASAVAPPAVSKSAAPRTRSAKGESGKTAWSGKTEANPVAKRYQTTFIDTNVATALRPAPRTLSNTGRRAGCTLHLLRRDARPCWIAGQGVAMESDVSTLLPEL